MDKLKELFVPVILSLTFLGVMSLVCSKYMTDRGECKAKVAKVEKMKKKKGGKSAMEQRLNRLRQSDAWSKSKRERMGWEEKAEKAPQRGGSKGKTREGYWMPQKER